MIFGEPYPYSLPNGAKVALVSSIALEMWSQGSTPGKNMPGSGSIISSDMTLPTRDIRVEKMIEFGAKVGIKRLLEIVDREGITCTLIANGRAIEENPEIVREIHARGNEICGHSYAQDASSYDFTDAEAERANIRKTVDVIEKVTGERPIGWESPRGTPSENTMRLLIEEGFTWCGDYADDELPYVLEIGGKPLVIVPYSGLAVNDYPVTINQRNTPRIYFEEFSKTLDLLLEEAALTGRPGLVRAATHAHLYGRSWGRWAFRDVIRYAKRHSDVWITTRGELAKHILAQYQEQNSKGN
ncbi:MAG: polysaccharide deacetylase family protein [Rhodospirillales bacterium]|nr:polysaccharide deacetylase [Rhodospirillaceae bacterium]MDP6426652.1 polysaccharide deacetylase family protein [Rhodospirillales bacterium]MDP6643214.1 polysaccharide deacetylase family protein [Rhodospirillales bacterium]MDP6843360.1 polysaccharide deacetylase family protein [Rhodospirillales bacterium]